MRKIQRLIDRTALRKNKKGGIEGLPLQLMITIIVASLGLALMVGWMGNIEAPKSIDTIDAEINSYGSSYNGMKMYSATIYVYDSEGYAVEGADVVITGLGAKNAFNNGTVTPHGVTDNNGRVTIEFYINPPATVGYLNLDVSKADYSGSSTRVMVAA